MTNATPVTAENTFSLAGKQLKLDTAKSIESYLGDLAAQKNVVKIDFSGNTIGIDASEALAKAILKHSETIEEINFSDLYTGRLNTEIPQSLDHLLNALLECPNLTTINLSDNAFGLQAIEPIEAWLAKAVSVEHLILSNNGMGPFAGARIGKSLFKLAQAKKTKGRNSLKTFVCGRNRLENGSINYLAIGLRAHKDLEAVRLYQNGIRPAGISKLLLQGLSHNSKLKVLDLQDNTITTSAAVGLATALKSWPELVELNLNDCLLKPKGSLLLVDRLHEGDKRPSFEKLKLQYNELEVDALEKLVKVVDEKLPNLKLLELNGNRFEEESELVDAITAIFEKRGSGELDELDDLEEPDSEEEDDDDEEDPVANEDDDADLNQLEKELAGVSVEDADKNVDDLADELASTHIRN
ncbi:hypothetical protein FT663_03373 [Candidozyma haemuli var. vulneris]|uniref:Ran GTPase-activating protein 1 n=1 Tax=Candidozyma haemuli TaxID=45357 RepID=A0A2V1ARR5_9ASCO|nr:hypothetical protein CXQ85_001740 [[Candida] haemuloni]KAF3989841.1 hypothetical protein FT662_02621 [[Candida] haemuloni var. vulneris]KAF3989995.1 hypothetical protein FT663_03373 [[Candida] haemuloni var. vulneris]PVH19963.1 hypothetical protein CXQ85_001740 [[Candida] haemuloni]